MNISIDELLNVKRFDSLPENYSEALAFFKAKGFDTELVEEKALTIALNKLKRNERLSRMDLEVFHQVVDVGDTCGCDNDHRWRGKDWTDKKMIGYSQT